MANNNTAATAQHIIIIIEVDIPCMYECDCCYRVVRNDTQDYKR